MKKISIVGLGKLGLPLAISFASKGFEVIGVDINPKTLEAIRKGKLVTIEPNLEEMLIENKTRLTVTDDLTHAVNMTDATIVMVATPSQGNGCFSLEYILPVCKDIGKILKNKETYHLVIISSTINPGDWEEILYTLEEFSGKNIGLCHVPEFVALGNILEGFLNPSFVLIGASDTKAAETAQRIYRHLYPDSIPIVSTNLINAELIKIVTNCYTVLKTAFGNQIAELCESIAGANVDIITSTIAMDTRISPLFLRGTTMAAGPCLPRDLKSIACLANRVGVELPLFQVVDKINYWQVERLARMVQKYWRRRDTIGILGLTYKPGVNVYEPSAGLLLLEKLYPATNVICFDPAIQVEQSVSQAQICADLADILVITTPWPEFKKIKFHEGQVVIDCWRMFDEELVAADGAKYVPIGIGPR